MGFYGNITNTSRTQFQFDKIYPNRYDMDNSKSVDGIYAGRYVLVEYDEATNLDTFIRAQRKVENGIVKFYYNPKGEATLNTLLTKAVIAAPSIIYTARVETTPEGGYHAKDCIFYICTSELVEGSQEPATFEETVNGDGLPNYTINAQSRSVRNLLSGRKVNPHKSFHGIAVIDSILDTFIGEVEPGLKHGHTEHLLNFYRLAPTLAVRVIRNNQ